MLSQRTAPVAQIQSYSSFEAGYTSLEMKSYRPSLTPLVRISTFSVIPRLVRLISVFTLAATTAATVSQPLRPCANITILSLSTSPTNRRYLRSPAYLHTLRRVKRRRIMEAFAASTDPSLRLRGAHLRHYWMLHFWSGLWSKAVSAGGGGNERVGRDEQ